jgi:hypothetical protein
MRMHHTADRSPDAFDPRPESGMGGASDAGAHGRHPASGGGAPPDSPVGDAPVERRRRQDPGYGGPERRLARR